MTLSAPAIPGAPSGAARPASPALMPRQLPVRSVTTQFGTVSTAPIPPKPAMFVLDLDDARAVLSACESAQLDPRVLDYLRVKIARVDETTAQAAA